MANTRKSSQRRGAEVADTAPPPAVEFFTDLPADAAAGTDKPVSILELGSSLSIREVKEYATQLKAMLAAGPIEIDATKLESIDTAGIQLLLVAAAAAQRRGFTMKLRGAQGIRTGAARSLGLNEHLAELAEILP
jgi:anti-anti-sigma regulatory factor